MSIKSVAWINGTLVKPQHFEQQESTILRYISNIINYLDGDLWGIDKLDVDEDFLKNCRINLKKCSGLFYDGTFFDNDTILSLDAKHLMAGDNIYLAIADNNYITDAINKNRRYGLESTIIEDNLEPSNDKIEITTKKLQICILTDYDDKEGFIYFPILKVKQNNQEKGIIFDENFIPPCLNIHHNSMLSQDLALLHHLLQQKQQQLANTLAAPLQTRNVIAATDSAILQIINRYEAKLSQLFHEPLVSPKIFYHHLADLVAELSTYYIESRYQRVDVFYQHKDIAGVFKQVKHILLDMLHVKFQHQAKEIILTPNDDAVSRAIIDDKNLLNNSDFIMVIDSDHKLDEKIVNNYIKLSSDEKIADIVNLQLSGLHLENVGVVPPQLPYSQGKHYFRISKQGDLWQDVVRTNTLSFYFESNWSVKEIKIWAVPENKSPIKE